MSTRTDKVNLVINVNGSAAQNQLNELRKKAADLSYELKNGLKRGTQEFIDKSTELRKVTSEMDNLKKSIGITSLSLRELASERRKLTAIRDSTVPLSKEFQDYDAQLQKVIARQNELRGSASSIKSTFGSIKQSITGLAAGYIGFQAVVGGIRALVTGSIQLSDQLGSLRRVAGFTKDEANELNKALLQIDTRTSGEGLRNIAIIAGKLGVAKGDILSFTQAVDKLVVALGDELGDADQITTNLGKILNVFDGEVTGDNISRLGNAFVELANAGVASGGFISDFTQRVAGIAKASNLSLGATVGLAAGFEELGLRSESSSTALQKLLSTIAADLPGAAKIANVPLEDFNKLFAESPQEALIKYAEGLVKNKNSFSEITSSFKDAGQEGARIVQTLQAIGQQGNFLREKIDQGNESIQNQTALNEGFALQNENLAGSVEKLGKAFDRLVANEKISSFLKGFVNILSEALDGIGYFIDSFKTLDEKIQDSIDKRKNDEAKFVDSIAQGMSGKSLEDQQKLVDSYKAIYMATQRELSDFLKSSNKDNLKERNRLLAQQLADEKIYLATQEKLNQTIKKEGNNNQTGQPTDPNSIAARKAQLEQSIKDTESAYQALNATDKKGQAANLALQKKFKAELDALMGVESKGSRSSSSKNTEYDKLKKEAAQFQQDMLKLKQDAELGMLSKDDEEIKRVELKYKELLQRAIDYHAKHLTSEADFLAQKKILSNLQTNEATGIVSEKEYKNSLAASDKYFDDLKKQIALDYSEGLKDEVQYKEALENLEKESTSNRIRIHEDYIGFAKSANAGLISESKKQYDADLKAFIQTEEQKAKANEEAIKKAKELNSAEKISGARLDVATARPGSSNELAAKKRLLDIETEMKAAALRQQYDISEESWKSGNVLYEELTQERLQKGLDLENEHWNMMVNKANEYASMVVDAFTSLNTILSNRESRELANDRRINEEKKRNLKNQLDGKFVSQTQYQKKIEALENEQAQKEKAIRKKQAEREKAMAIFQALVSSASAVVAALGAKPWTPANFVFAGVVAALGALKVAAIASTPLPEAARGKWFRDGKKHSEGGIDVEIEKDEAVIMAKAMNDNKKYTVTGTPAQITSKLNSLHGGENWASGAVMRNPQILSTPQLNRDLPQIMAKGSVASDNSNSIQMFQEMVNKQSEMIYKQTEMIQVQKESLNEIRTQKESLHAVVSIKEFRKKEKQYDNARKAGSMGQ